MKIRRDISSIPFRTAEQTWSVIRELITKHDSIDADQLEKAASVMHSLIADECLDQHPITVTGGGHRLVIYLRYRGQATEEGANTDSLDWNPTAGDWKMYIPCTEENIEWVKKALSSRATRMVVHGLEEEPYKEDAKKNQTSSAELNINWGVVGG